MCGFTAQLVEHRTGIAEVMGSNPFEGLNIFQASSFQLFKLEIYCDDHSLLSFTTAVQYEFHIYFSNSLIIHKEKTKEITTAKEVWICDPNYLEIRRSFGLIFSKNYQCFEKLYQTLKRVFHQISKYFKVG